MAAAPATPGSRRTRSIAQGTRRPSGGSVAPLESGSDVTAQPIPTSNDAAYQTIAEEPEKKGLAQFFQFHIIISCLLVLLILCIMSGVGGVMLLQWLIEGS